MKTLLTPTIVLAALALASQTSPTQTSPTQSSRALFVNGKASNTPVLELGGKTYISTDALQTAGADVTVTPQRVTVQFVPVARQNEQNYVDGVIGEFVANEVWRVRVTQITKIPNPINGVGQGIQLKVDIRNGGQRAAAIGNTGLRAVTVLDDQSNRLRVASSSFKDQYSNVQPGGGFTNDLKFGSDAVREPGTPTKLILEFGNSGGRTLKNIRIDLTQPPTN